MGTLVDFQFVLLLLFLEILDHSLLNLIPPGNLGCMICALWLSIAALGPTGALKFERCNRTWPLSPLRQRKTLVTVKLERKEEKAVFRIRICPDPKLFGLKDPDLPLFHIELKNMF